jgi:hypothetical protein
MASVLLFTASVAPALAAGEERDSDRPTAEATIEDTDNDTLLVHTQTVGQHTVCADAHGTTDVVVSYDSNQTNISPGHCALLEAGQISVHAGGQGKTHVTVHSQKSHGGRGGN